jgi:hypothetical protein
MNMLLRKHLSASTMIRIGSLFLVLAILTTKYVHPSAGFWANVADGVMGCFYGISITCLLRGAWLNSHRAKACGN